MTGQTILNNILSLCDKNSNDTEYRALALIWYDLVLKDIQNHQEGFHWRFLEVRGTKFALAEDDFDYLLTTIASNIDTTKAIHVYDKINDRTYDFVPYETFRQRVANETNDSGTPYIFSIFGGYLLLWPVSSFAPVTGTCTDTTANKLRDATATFTTSGVLVGMLATKTATNQTALITAIDSAIALSVDTDLFAATVLYSISYCVYIDYIRMLSDAADSTDAILIPDKYKTVVYDGILKYAYSFDPELGDAGQKALDYEAGIARMLADNQQIIAENNVPVSHRDKYKMKESMDGRHYGLFPLDNANM